MLVHLAVIQELITRLIPDREAIIWREGVLTYAAFLRRCRQVGHALRTLGLGCHTERGRVDPWESGQDHVAVCMYNCPEWLEVMYGSYHARAVMVNVNYRYKADELRYVLANSGARALVYHAAFAPPAVAMPFSVFMPGMSYSSKVTPRAFNSATSRTTSSTCQKAWLALDVPAFGVGYRKQAVWSRNS